MDNTLSPGGRIRDASLPLKIASIPVDWRNLALLTAAYGLLILLLSPQRDYAVIDDWIYAQAARHLQVTGAFARPDWAVTSLVAQAWWGSVFASLFGYSLTTLTWSVLFLSWAGVLCFYGLMRALEIRPGAALFGAAILMLNPVYLHLSYSFMTDVPFLALLLAAALCVVRGVQGDDDARLLIAMLLTALACLVRQTGVLAAGALFLYLLLARRLSPRRLALVLVPVIVLGLYLVWQQSQPPAPALLLYTGGASGQSENGSPAFGPGVWFFRTLLLLPTLGLWMLPLASAVFWRRLPIGWASGGAALGALMVITYRGVPSSTMYMPLDYTASVLYSSGFFIFTEPSSVPPPILTPAAWGVISILMIGTTAWMLAGLGAAFGAKVRALLTRRSPGPRDFVYIFGVGAGLATFFGLQIYDRYFLPLLPCLIIVLLRRMAGGARWRWAVAGAILVVVGGFSLLAQADFADRATARWTAGNEVLSRGITYSDLAAGYEWNGMHYYDALGRRLLDSRPFSYGEPHDLAYTISDNPRLGYHTVGRVPYFSRLGGFTSRSVLLLERDAAGAGP
jgi:4-amino-4-deoxy-L-arabinose transferase-like glycosyltransferase